MQLVRGEISVLDGVASGSWEMAVERILHRLYSPNSVGYQILATRYNRRLGGLIYSDRVDEGLFQQWRTSSVAFSNTFPNEYIYSREFETSCQESGYDDTVQGLEILCATKEDIEGGHLHKVESLVADSVFSGFLEMAEYLLGDGNKDLAASLIEVVLEDDLRRIFVNDFVTLKTKEDISSLNQKLAQKQIYNPI